MTTLVFLLAALAIFGTVYLVESRGDAAPHAPAGLWTWITRGNWPAKVGAGLVIVGFGALLRYALINIEIAPELKLGSGIAVSLLLGLLATLLPRRGVQRAVSLSLGGAAFGVAYMTAYAAFAYYHYLSNPMGLAALGVASAGAAAYALSRGAPSLGVLSMVGAFLAPAFAVSDPGPLVVYGYYTAASLLVLAMVAVRGWRPLMHLSLLFTIGGGAFLAWTAHYYVHANAAVMLPAVLVLATIHLAMSMVGPRADSARWLQRFDIVYAIVLPLSVALAALLLAPDRARLAAELLGAAAVWLVGAVALTMLRRPGAGVLWVITVLFAVLGIATRFQDMPWELVCLALAVVTLAFTSRRTQSPGTLHHVLAGLVVLLGSLHVLRSFTAPDALQAFLNRPFLERFAGGALLVVAGALCRRIRQPLDTLLLAMGILWATFAVGHELVRFDLATFALVLHFVLVLLAFSIWIPGRRLRWVDDAPVAFGILVLLTAGWAAQDPHAIAAHVASLLAPLAILGLAFAPNARKADDGDQREVLLLLVPTTAALWAIRIGAFHGIDSRYFPLFTALGFALVAVAVGARTRFTAERWFEQSIRSLGLVVVALLLVSTLFDISRSPWAVATECLALAMLFTEATIVGTLASPTVTIAAVLATLLVAQADLLRWLVPDGPLDIGAIRQLRWPALLSLAWASGGCALTLLGKRRGSRPLWIAGATLLVGAAVKLFLLDFGTLGQLGNILAVIAAGGAFLLVGWLAPLPPAGSSVPRQDAALVPGYNWPIAILAIAAVTWFIVADSTLRALASAVQPTQPGYSGDAAAAPAPVAEVVQSVAIAAAASLPEEARPPVSVEPAVTVNLPPSTEVVQPETVPDGASVPTNPQAAARVVAAQAPAVGIAPPAPSLSGDIDPVLLDACIQQTRNLLMVGRRVPAEDLVRIKVQAEVICRHKLADSTAAAPAAPARITPVFRCAGPDGGTVFSDTPCNNGAKQAPPQQR
jgi:uncharacterized membrane protein